MKEKALQTMYKDTISDVDPLLHMDILVPIFVESLKFLMIEIFQIN